MFELLGVGHELIGERDALVLGQRRVPLGGRPQILLDGVPTGPQLTVGEVGLAQVELGVEVAERFRDGLDALPVRAGIGVERSCGVVVAGHVEVGELDRLLEELRRLVSHVQLVLRAGGGDQLLDVARSDLLARIGDGERAADAVADHSRFAGGEVLAGACLDDEVAGEARADVLDLADDAQPVVAEQVELGDLVAIVGHLEDEVAAGCLCRADLAGLVGAADGHGAFLAVGVVRGARCADDGEAAGEGGEPGGADGGRSVHGCLSGVLLSGGAVQGWRSGGDREAAVSG